MSSGRKCRMRKLAEIIFLDASRVCGGCEGWGAVRRGEGGAHPAIDTGQRPRRPVHGAQRPPPPTTDNLTHICARTAAAATAAGRRRRAAAMAASLFRVQDKLVDMEHKHLNEFEFSSSIL